MSKVIPALNVENYPGITKSKLHLAFELRLNRRGSPLGLEPFIEKDMKLVEKGAAHRHLALRFLKYI
jgi:hypothetical protein